MEPEGSFLCPQDPAIRPCSELNETIPHHSAPFL